MHARRVVTVVETEVVAEVVAVAVGVEVGGKQESNSTGHMAFPDSHLGLHSVPCAAVQNPTQMLVALCTQGPDVRKLHPSHEYGTTAWVVVVVWVFVNVTVLPPTHGMKSLAQVVPET